MTRHEKWDLRYLELAKHIASWSKDPSTKTGVVIVAKNGSVVSMGYNGFPIGVADTEERYNDRDTKYKIVVHAERNAIIFATGSLKNCTAYVWPWLPCTPCAGMMIQAGIQRCVTLKNLTPRWQTDFALTEQIFKEVGIVLDFLEEKNDI